MKKNKKGCNMLDNPMRLIKDILYIDAGYRRKILDKWVILREYSDEDDMIYLYKKIINGNKFENPDLQYWSNKFKKLKSEKKL